MRPERALEAYGADPAAQEAADDDAAAAKIELYAETRRQELGERVAA